MNSIPSEVAVVGITGHRIQSFNEAAMQWVQQELKRVLGRMHREHGANVLATGMAIGTDMWAAQIGIREGMLHVPFLPFEGEAQRERWPAVQQRFHARLLAQSWTPFVFGDLPVHPEDMPSGVKRKLTSDAMLAAFHLRNEAIVSASDVMVAAWNGRTYGGTAHALRCAVTSGKPIILLRVRDRMVSVANPTRLAEHLDVTLPTAQVA